MPFRFFFLFFGTGRRGEFLYAVCGLWCELFSFFPLAVERNAVVSYLIFGGG